MNIKAQIPNLITLGNLLCGALAIYFVSQGNPALASILILAAAFLDFFDGMSARLLKIDGELGKQLDSLADVISFGLAPAFIAISMTGVFNMESPSVLAFVPLIMAAFSAYRLGKFNIDPRQEEAFIGLPTPSNALFWLAFPLIAEYQSGDGFLSGAYAGFMESTPIIVTASVILGVLLVSEIRLFSLKFKSFSWKGNEPKFILIGLSLILLVLIQLKAIPIIVLLYIIVSFIKNLISN
jgi:CDP-diacylglycerol--serine O-phosphatidyltransferase